MYARRNPRIRAFCAGQLVYIGAGHVLTYTRSQWLALVLGLGFMGLILAPRYWRYSFKAILIAASGVLVLASVWIGGQPEVPDTPFVTGVIDRFDSLLSPAETLATKSLQWRTFENGKALRAIQEQPLVGVGLGGSYRDLTIGEASGTTRTPSNKQ